MKKISINKSFRIDLTNIKRNSSFLIFALFIAVGVLTGVFCYRNINAVKEEALNLFREHYEFHSQKGFFRIIGQTFLNIIPIVLIAFVVGTSAVGCVLTPALPFVSGFVFGIVSGSLYSTQEVMGIVYNLLVLLPPTLVAFFGLLLCCRESFGFSKLLAIMCVKGGKCFNLYLDFKNYCIRYLVILALFLFYALVDASLTSLFIRFFKF